jgi:hypothetical protein
MRIIVVAVFACIAAMIVLAPHPPHPDRIPAATVTAIDSSTLPTQDCMNSVAGADGYDAPTQDCLGTL